MIQNMKAFLDMLAWSEGTTRIPGSDNGYNVLVGSTPDDPEFFRGYLTHPRIYNPYFNSTAAGRYQIIFPTWSSLCARLNVTDFSPATQDAMAISLITEDCGAANAVTIGDFIRAVSLCSKEWASLPGSNSGQWQSLMANLIAIYTASGGTLMS